MSERPVPSTDFAEILATVEAAESASDVYDALSNGLAALGYDSFTLQAASWGAWMKVTNIRVDPDKLRRFQSSKGISLNGYTCPVAKDGKVAKAQQDGQAFYAEDPKVVVGDLMQSYERYMAGDVTRGLGMGPTVVVPLPCGQEKTPVLFVTCAGLDGSAVPALDGLGKAVGKKVEALGTE